MPDLIRLPGNQEDNCFICERFTKFAIWYHEDGEAIRDASPICRYHFEQINNEYKSQQRRDQNRNPDNVVVTFIWMFLKVIATIAIISEIIYLYFKFK